MIAPIDPIITIVASETTHQLAASVPTRGSTFGYRILESVDTAAAVAATVPAGGASVPAVSNAVDEAIADSLAILNLEDDWDGEGAIGYAPETRERAVGFLRVQALHKSTLPAPLISPADKGAVDLYWQLMDRSLLVNFPADGRPASFFGKKTNAAGTIGGFIDGTELRADLIEWLTSK